MNTFPPMDGLARSGRFTAWAALYGPFEARRLANALDGL